MSEAFAEPFDAILELGGEPLREAMANVETRLREITALEAVDVAKVATDVPVDEYASFRIRRAIVDAELWPRAQASSMR